MTDKEVLQKAIEIAIDNGYRNRIMMNGSGNSIIMENGDLITPNHLILSHEFAKAFFGNKTHKKNSCDIIDNCTCGELTYHYYETYEKGEVRNCTEYCWQYHLQQMVLEENPIDYLRKFIE